MSSELHKTNKIARDRVIGARIERERRRRGLSQRELAMRVGLKSAGSINNYEKGTRGVRAQMLNEIASALGIRVEILQMDNPMSLEASETYGAAVPESTPKKETSRERLVRLIKDLVPRADAGVIDALLKNVEQFSRIKPEDKDDD